MRIAVTAVVSAALAATAATGVGARTKPDQRQIGDMTAQCVVGAEPARARALLATLPGSPAEQRAARRLAPTFAACSEGAFNLSAGSRNAGLFSGRADLAAALATEVAANGRQPDGAAAAWYLAATKAAPKGGFDGVLLGVQEFGACIVAADAADALKLVRSEPRSREEQEALAGLRPVLSPCVVQDAKLNFTRDELRLAVAEPLYHALTGGPAPTAAR